LSARKQTEYQLIVAVRFTEDYLSELPGVVFKGPVSGLEKDCNWTGLDQSKDWTAVLVFDIEKSKTANGPVFLDRFKLVSTGPMYPLITLSK
jgi:hypothetical protein